MVIIFFLLFWIFTRPILATPTVQITVTPSSLSSVGTTFPVQFIITNADANSNYYYKFCGGIGSSDTQIQTTPSLSCGSEWINFSTVNIDTGGSAVVNSYAYIKPDVPSGSYNLYTRIALIPKGTTWTTHNSSNVTISVTTPPPTCVYNYSSWSECTSSSTQTRTATLTSTSECIGTSEVTTQNCTYDATIINPTSGIIFNEFMPYKNFEWIEIFNDNNVGVKLDNWSIYDSDGKIFDINNLIIESKKYKIIEWSGYKLNDSGDSVSLYNNYNSVISQYSYPTGKYINDNISWSYINGSWCQAEITKNTSNASSCYSAPTLTPTPTIINSPTPTFLITPTALPTDKNLYQLDETATASAIFTPIEENIPQTTPTISSKPITSNLVLGQTTTAKKNYLPLTFIVSGGFLLMSPILIDKFKKK